jgi:hypothetical protein
MPHIPDTLHDTHDLELVAAYAAGDASGEALARATTLVAGCAQCAALHHDLRAIAAAMPELPAPVRPRDFRLSPEQAASLRPAGLRGFLSTLAGPRFSFATPLGSGLAALGIVGVLVASGGLGAGGATSGQPAAAPDAAVTQPQAEAPAETTAAANGAANAAPSEAPASVGIEQYDPTADASAAPSAAPSAGAGDGEVVAGAQPDATTDPIAAVPAGSPVPAATAGPGVDDNRTTAMVVETPGPDDTSAKDLAVDTQAPVLVPAMALLLAGLVLVAVRWWARRVV